MYGVHGRLFTKESTMPTFFLENVNKADMDESVKTRMKGEAKFLRAYFHFLLVQGWYEVPIRKTSFKDVNNSSIEATPHADALDWIIGEMEECVNLVDDQTYDKSPSYIKKEYSNGYPCPRILVACRISRQRRTALLCQSCILGQ